MNTITFLDICRERSIATIDYSCHPKTLDRWRREGKAKLEYIADSLGYDWNRYGLAKPSSKEEWAVIENSFIVDSSLPVHDIDWQLFELAQYLNDEQGITHCKVYFYQTATVFKIAGIELQEDN